VSLHHEAAAWHPAGSTATAMPCHPRNHRAAAEARRQAVPVSTSYSAMESRLAPSVAAARRPRPPT